MDLGSIFTSSANGSCNLLAMDAALRWLQPPIAGQVVLGWDPAFRTGCKLAVVDATGKVLDTVVVFWSRYLNGYKFLLFTTIDCKYTVSGSLINRFFKFIIHLVDSYKRLIAGAIEREIRSSLTENAEDGAIADSINLFFFRKKSFCFLFNRLVCHLQINNIS